MRTVNWSVTEVDTPLATGQVVGNWHFRALVAGTEVLAEDSPTSNGSVSLAAGLYDLEAYRLDTTGALVGVVATLSAFEVADLAPVVETGKTAGALSAVLA